MRARAANSVALVCSWHACFYEAGAPASAVSRNVRMHRHRRRSLVHALMKILAKASGMDYVEQGQIVTAKVDLAEVNDLYLQVLVSFREMGASRVWDTSKVAFVLDHYAPAPTIRAAANHKEMREFVREHSVKHLFDINTGVCHQVLVEAGLVRPGMLVIETDSHTTTMGAIGAFGTGCGATDMAAILATGETWLRVPEIVRIDYHGSLPRYVTGKDIALKTLGLFGTDFANYKAIEYAGTPVLGLSMSCKMALCNMAVEMAAKTSYIQPTQDVLDYVRSRTTEPVEPVFTDASFEYPLVLDVCVDGMEPQVACPSRVDNVRPVSEVEGERIDQAFVGTCTGGRLDDIAVAARLLSGRKISADCRLLVAPASSEILKKAIEAGYISSLIDSGATIVTPGCGPCLGAHEGVLAPGERCITASSRNFPGRMGSPRADVFVASPATVAASAINARITDPRRYLQGE